MSIILPSPRSSQPDVFPVVNPGNPLARGLLASFPMVAGGRMYDASVNRRHSNQLSFSNMSWSSGPSVSRLKFDGSQAVGSASWGNASWVQGIGAITFEFEFSINNAAAGGTILNKWGSSSADWSFLVEVGTNGTVYFVIMADALYIWQTATGVFSSNVNYHVVCTWPGGANAKAYVNGIERTYTTAPAAPTGGIRIGGANFQIATNNSGGGPACSVGMVNIWNRALTNAEAYSRYMNRWSLFAPSKSVMLSDFSGAAPAPTIYELQSFSRGVGRGIAGGIA